MDDAEAIGSIVITIRLPIPVAKVCTILGAVAKEFPAARVDYSQVPWKIDVGPC